MLTLVGKLYAVEKETTEVDDTTRFALRQERSVPVLTQIKGWLDTEADVVLPRSPMAQAITYARNQWDALTTYTTKGFLAIGNNASERALKRVALGKRIGLLQATIRLRRIMHGYGPLSPVASGMTSTRSDS